MRQKLIYTFIFSPILIAAFLLFVPVHVSNNKKVNIDYHHTLTDSPKIDPEKLIFLLQYIGNDYGDAVENRKVINEFEYQEMLDFSRTVYEWYQEIRPENESNITFLDLQKLHELIKDKADWTTIKFMTSNLIPKLSKELNVIPYPTRTPNLVNGEFLYNNTCSECHGLSGDGRGPSAKGLKPPPCNFQDPEHINKATSYQFFNAITYGIKGTPMPSFQQVLTDQERWNIAFYLMTLRKDFSPKAPKQEYSISVKDLAILSNEDLIHQLKSQSENGLWADSENFQWLAVIDYLRQNPPQISPKERLLVTKQRLNQSLANYQKGHLEKAVKLTLDAYLEGIEPLEPHLLQKDPTLVTRMEQEFSKFRGLLKSGSNYSTVNYQHRKLLNILEQAKLALEPSEIAWGFALIQSSTIVLREGVEAALLIALMITYLMASGYRRLKKYVVAGALAGIILGGLTWITAQFFVQISHFQQEALEGITSLLAAVVLFSVSFWIIHNIDLYKWKRYIRSKAEKALGTGSGIALAMAAFLAVYREAFETVLFYQALWLRSSTFQSSVVIGFLIGVIILAFLIILIFKLGLRIPLNLFFGVTGILLGLLAFIFAGYGVRELQNMDWLKATSLSWNFNWNLLEIHPTLEGVAIQFGILFSFLLGWFFIYFQKIKSSDEVELKSAPVN